MKVKELVKELGLFVDYNKSDLQPDDNITFYFLKNDTLTNCQLETIIETDMGVEFTIQDTSELQEIEQ